MKKTIEMARDAGFFVNENEVYSPSVQYDHELTPYLVRFAALVRADEREAIMQLFTDPENQPTQHGTVTVEYMMREIAAEREACAKVCDAWQEWGTDCALLAKAIRARRSTCTPPQTIEDEHLAKVTSDINLAVYKALAQPEQEPVGSVVRWVDSSLIHGWFGDPPPEGTLLYITPLQREWVGLTDEECMDAFDPFMGNLERARAIEAKLKEKNR